MHDPSLLVEEFDNKIIMECRTSIYTAIDSSKDYIMSNPSKILISNSIISPTSASTRISIRPTSVPVPNPTLIPTRSQQSPCN